MSKVQHVSRLIHERDTLVREREEIDERIAAIDAEIEHAWQGGATSPQGSATSPQLQTYVMRTPPPAPASTTVNGNHASVADDFDDDDEADEADADNDDSNLARLVGMIRHTPTLDYGSAAIALYGEDNAKYRKRIRSSLNYLHRKNRIKNLGRNRWEVLQGN